MQALIMQVNNENIHIHNRSLEGWSVNKFCSLVSQDFSHFPSFTDIKHQSDPMRTFTALSLGLA